MSKSDEPKNEGPARRDEHPDPRPTTWKELGSPFRRDGSFVFERPRPMSFEEACEMYRRRRKLAEASEE